MNSEPPAASVARHDAFISYSHAADGALAKALQSGLHRLARPYFRLRALRVFRDQTSLSASAALWGGIEEALRSSRYFLFLASPAAAQSLWVQREIEWWVAHRPAATMLILVTEGDIRWDETGHDFDWSATNCLPRKALSGRFAGEPLWVDLRWARSAQGLTLRHARFRQAVLDVAAPIHGIDKDRLDGDDVRRMARVRYTTGAAIATLGALLVAVFGLFVEANRQAEEARRRGLVAEARRLATQAELMRAQRQGDADLRLLLATEAMRRLASVGEQDSSVDLFLRRAIAERPLLVARFDRSPQRGSSKTINLEADGQWQAIQRETEACRSRWPEAVATSPDGRWCLVETREGPTKGAWQLLSLDRPERPERLRLSLPPNTAFDISRDGRWVALRLFRKSRVTGEMPTYFEGDCEVWRDDGVRVLATPGEPCLQFSPDSTLVATTAGLWQLPAEAAAKPVLLWPWHTPITRASFSADSRWVAVKRDERMIDVWSRDAGRDHGSMLLERAGDVLAVDNGGGSVLARTGNSLQALGRRGSYQLPLAVDKAAFMPTGVRLVSCALKECTVLDLPSRGPAHELQLDDGLQALVLFADINAVTLLAKAENPLRFQQLRWDLGTRKPQVLHEFPYGLWQLSPDERRWAVRTGGASTLWVGDAAGNLPPKQIHEDGPVATMALSDAGDLAVLLESGQLIVRDPDGRRRWSLEDARPLAALDFAPGGGELRALIDGGQPHQRGTRQTRPFRLQAWRVADGTPVRSIELGLRDPLRLIHVLCQLSADGRSLTLDGKDWPTAGTALPEDADWSKKEACFSRAAAPWRAQYLGDTLLLWQGEKLLYRLEGDAKIEGVALAPDRSLAVTTDSVSHLRVWRLAPADLVAQACARGPRKMTGDEALLWLGARAAADPCGRAAGPP